MQNATITKNLPSETPRLPKNLPKDIKKINEQITSRFFFSDNNKKNMDITTNTIKKIKQLKNTARKMKVIFDKQLPQMKPILSSIKKDLHEIITIIQQKLKTKLN